MVILILISFLKIEKKGEGKNLNICKFYCHFKGLSLGASGNYLATTFSHSTWQAKVREPSLAKIIFFSFPSSWSVVWVRPRVSSRRPAEPGSDWEGWNSHVTLRARLSAGLCRVDLSRVLSRHVTTSSQIWHHDALILTNGATLASRSFINWDIINFAK